MSSSSSRFTENQWALILGGSSGFGLATAKKLSAEGMSVCVVHRDRKGAMARIETDFEDIRKNGHSFFNLNLDALSAEGIATVINALTETLGTGGKIRVFLHSIAFGNLKAIAPPADAGSTPPLMEDEDMARTIYAMGTSLLTWVQTLHRAKLFSEDARVLSLTSEGNEVAWRGYAAVAAAKSALESVSRAIAVEFAPHGIRSNVIQAGVTDTPALRLIPGNEGMKSAARERNPFHRLTRPEDVADVITLLCTNEARWINGALLRVDGGEHIASG